MRLLIHTHKHTIHIKKMTTGLQQERIVTPNNSSTTKLNTELQMERHLHPFVLKVAFRAPVFCIQSQINHSSNTSTLRQSGIQATCSHKKTNWSSSPGLLRAQKQSNWAPIDTQRSTHRIPLLPCTRFYKILHHHFLLKQFVCLTSY